jgi:hypothetical protein
MDLEVTNSEKLKRDALSLLRVGWSVDRIADHFTSYREDYGTGLSFGSIRFEILKLISSKDDRPTHDYRPDTSIEPSLQDAACQTTVIAAEIIQQYSELTPEQFGPDDFITRFRPFAFFHFTDTRNLFSIRKHGLCSLSEIERRNIPVAAYGGNPLSQRLDWEMGRAIYVHLCFHPEHPMEYRAKEEKRVDKTVFIRVSREVLRLDGIKFTSEVANSSSSKLLTLDQAVESMDFPVIFDRTNWSDPDINRRRQITKKYEILVPISIPPEFLEFPNHG